MALILILIVVMLTALVLLNSPFGQRMLLSHADPEVCNTCQQTHYSYACPDCEA